MAEEKKPGTGDTAPGKAAARKRPGVRQEEQKLL